MPHARKILSCVFLVVVCLGASLAGGSTARAAGAADGARDLQPTPPPGVIIAPKRNADDEAADPNRRDDDHPGEQQGCPANTRKLELIA